MSEEREQGPGDKFLVRLPPGSGVARLAGAADMIEYVNCIGRCTIEVSVRDVAAFRRWLYLMRIPAELQVAAANSSARVREAS